MNRTPGMFRRAAALACALVLTLSLVPWAGAITYQSSWLTYGGHEFTVRFVISMSNQTSNFTLRSYSPGGAALSEPYASIYAVEDGCEAEQVLVYSNGVHYDSVTVTGCSVSISGSTMEIRDSGVSMPLNAGDTMSKANFGGYDAVRYFRTDHSTAGTTYDVVYYFLLGDTINSGGSSGGTPANPTNPGDTTSPGGTASPGDTTNPGGTANPGDTTNPGGSQNCDHANQPSSGWTYETVKATCKAEGRSYRVCKTCGFEETLSTTKKTDHTWQQKTQQATATTAGRVYRVCSVCGAEETISTIDPVKPADASHGSGSVDLPKLSQAEITKLLKDAPLELPQDIYDVQPSTTAPHSPGKIKSSVLQAALDRLNANRRIAGLPNVALDSALCETAQYGAVLTASIGMLDHNPSKPSGMDDAFYRKGAYGTSSSNLARGYTLNGAVDGWMNDSGSSNIARIGHRRWQLNPTMGKVGFGYCDWYSVEMVFDHSGSKVNYNYIAWPASGNFPTELFDKNQAWSVSLNPSEYAAPSKSGLTVTLSGGGNTWTLSGNYSAASSGKYLNVIPADGYNYGNNHCIIFRPDGVNAYDGTYTVTISGLRDKSGNPATLTYDVDFFKAGTSGTGTGTTAQQPQDSQKPQDGQNPQPTEPGNPFTDVPAGSYYHDAVLWALDKGVTTGVTATQFQPNSTCTRGQVVTFLWRAKGSPEPKTKTNPFTDVSSSSPFYKAILWAQENGITTGTTATTFNPGGTCTSGHVVTFLWRAEGEPQASGSSALANTYSGQYYTNAIAWADGGGLLTGVGGTFVPSQRSPRANIVTYLYRNLAQ